MLERIKPMEPVQSERIMNSNEWIHEIKWDGIRGISYITDGKLTLFTKSGNIRTDTYPEVQKLLNIFKGRNAIFDGELIVFNEDDKPSFQYILNRDRTKNKSKISQYVHKYPVKYLLFDILYLNSKDLRSTPLEERKGLLDYNIEKNGDISVTNDFSDGEGLLKLMKSMNYEGIVSKKIKSPYVQGKKHDYWYKIKIKRKLLAIMAGLNTENGIPKSIILAIHIDNNMKYIGSVSSGLKSDDLNLLKKISLTHSLQLNPFDEMDSASNNVIWLKPEITLWIEFLEWTDDGLLRHPKISGFSDMDITKADGREYIL